MESIEKLRESLKACISRAGIEPNQFDTYWITARACDMLIDEIEREIAERYMELPVDANGVPIHCGERMRLDNGHEGDVWLIGTFDIMMSDHTCFDWAKSRHVKPRTLEDVLEEFGTKVLHSGHQWRLDAQHVIAEYAAEIREMMEADE